MNPRMTVEELVRELRRCADEIESLGQPLSGHAIALLVYARRIDRHEIEWSKSAAGKGSDVSEKVALPVFGPKAADHPTIGRSCPLCGIKFGAGDYTCLLGDEPDEVHADCIPGPRERVPM